MTESERQGMGRVFHAAWEAQLPEGIFEVVVNVMAGWKRCKTAKLLATGWLEYELEDGSTGSAKPKHWRTTNSG